MLSDVNLLRATINKVYGRFLYKKEIVLNILSSIIEFTIIELLCE